MARRRFTLPAAISQLVETVAAAGGRALLVGGTVLDVLSDQTPQDWDLEVHGLSMERLERVLADLSPRAVGKSFGVFLLDPARVDGLAVDVSVPRRESRVGVGHRDFRCEFDPSMTLREAARRRDFTLNTVMIDPRRDEILDPWGGLDDWRAGLLRLVDERSFVEDPLRGLRAMQLLARRARRVEPRTLQVIASMSGQFHTLPRERVAEEWAKLLLKGSAPSRGLVLLEQSGWLEHFPELRQLVHWSGWERHENRAYRERFASDGCPQNPEWHPEGDVWVHNNLVLDAAARVREHIDPEWRLAFMYGALLHDVAKPPTTELPRCTAHGHDHLGEELGRTFMARLSAERLLIDRVAALVRCHLQPFLLVKAGSGDAAWRRLHRRCLGRLDVLGWLSRADWAGRPGRDPVGPREDGRLLRDRASERCWELHRQLGVEPLRPLLQGRDLIAAGWSPGAHFGPALAAAFEAQLDHPDWNRERLLQIALATAGD